MFQPNYTVIDTIESWIYNAQDTLWRTSRQLERAGDKLAHDLKDVHSAIASCNASIATLRSAVDVVIDAEARREIRLNDHKFNETEVTHLLDLNRRLKRISNYMSQIANEVTPGLQAKAADPQDLMEDYEIEAVLTYQLRDNDPDCRDDCDNFITIRRELLKSRNSSLNGPGFGECGLPTELEAASHCWLFHDLYDHDLGVDSPAVSLRNCLRIGSIFLDVYIVQQYCFEEASINAYSVNTDGMPEHNSRRHIASDSG